MRSNNNQKNENAVASIGIAKTDIKENDINVNIIGIAFLSSRVNVLNHKTEKFIPLTAEKNVDAKVNTAGGNK